MRGDILRAGGGIMAKAQRQHGLRNVPGWQRMGVRERAALARKMQLENLAKAFEERVQRLEHHNNIVVVRQEAILDLLFESGHTHPEAERGLLLLSRGVTPPVPITRLRFEELVKAKTEQLLAQQPPAETPEQRRAADRFEAEAKNGTDEPVGEGDAHVG